MDDSEARLARLEHRLLVLEDLVRRALPPAPAARPAPGDISPTIPDSSALKAPRIPLRERLAAQAQAEHLTPRVPARPALNLEEWFGQRGMLAVGVLLLLLAGGYFLKIAMDRGWISPATRCVVAILSGHAIMAVGWRAYRSRTRTYGAALIGAGAGLIYLAIWAAARMYALVAPELGVAGLAYIAIATSAVAWRLELEALGAGALLGALLGPVLIGADPGSANTLLLYLTAVLAALGWPAVRQQWRISVVLSLFTAGCLALAAIQDALALPAVAFATAFGVAGLWLRRRWPESGFVAVLGSWAMLLTATSSWLPIAGGVVLTLPVFLGAFRTRTVWPDWKTILAGDTWSMHDALFFYGTPYLLWLTAEGALRTLAIPHEGWAAAALAIPYLLAGYGSQRNAEVPRSPFALVGAIAATTALCSWPPDGMASIFGLLALSLLFAGFDHLQTRRDGRWYALIALTGVALEFLEEYRGAVSPAFVDPWALGLWSAVLVLVVMARGLWRVEEVPAVGGQGAAARGVSRFAVGQAAFVSHEFTFPLRVRTAIWITAGTVLFGFVTNDLQRLFGQIGLDPAGARLAGGLAVSIWWALSAGALVGYGFYRRIAPVRVAGLVVAGLAIIKVLFVDLASLDQLYRVGSFIVLALVLLLVAWLYHRQSRQLAEADAEAGEAGSLP